MAEPEVRISTANVDDSLDIDMQGNDNGDVLEVGETNAQADAPGDDVEEEESQMETETSTARSTFTDYLKSPIITLRIGPPPSTTTLTAHQLLLLKSPYLTTAISPSSPSPQTTISLPTTDLEATSCVLEYLYTGEYFPPKTPSGTLTSDPSLPAIDSTGSQLLKHAKVYTLADKFSLPALKTLAHSKIHLINSTAVAEINYARYVYSNTEKGDTTIRKPVASFWGQRSHVLRHETEGSFREMCLEYPEFAFDVLSFVLDAEEKREERRRKTQGGGGGEEGEGVKGGGSARKRQRGI